MNMAHRLYAQPPQDLQSPRNVEYALLGRVTQRLCAAWDRREEDFVALARAVSDNDRLWMALAADVAVSSNGLPAPLRAGVLYLARFSEIHGRKVLDGTGDITVLIDVNTAVMRGLRGAQEGPK